ncbi:MAG TPA: hypothetical protein VHM90_11540 [Phycisphaerae bacterium]|nr:hypothetical protein [Phycisphaerae bacterium]
MHDHLAERLSKEFPGKVALGKIVPLPKGREVMLEGADIIAGGMLRRTLYKGSNPKDVLEGLKTQPTTAQFSKCTFEVSNIIGFNIKAENNDAMGRTSNNTAASF